MQDFRIGHRVKRGAMQFGGEQVRSWWNKILGTPKDLAKYAVAQVVAWVLFLTAVPAGKAILALWVSLVLFNPFVAIAVLIVSATILIGIGCLIANRVLGKWTQVDLISERYTESLAEGLNEEQKVFFQRLKPGTKECDDVTKDYERKIKVLYEERSKSLGIDIKEALGNQKGTKFRAMCFHARKVLKQFPEVYSSSKAIASQFSEAEKEEIQRLYKDFIGSIDGKKVTLKPDTGFIENMPEQQGTHLYKLLSGFNLDVEINNDRRHDLTTQDAIHLIKQSINILKVDDAITEGNISQLLADAQSPFSSDDIAKAIKLMEVLSSTNYSDYNESRLADIYAIFNDGNSHISSLLQLEIYTLINRASNETVVRCLHSTDVFKNDHELLYALNNFHLGHFQNASLPLHQAINIVQCIDKLLVTAIAGDYDIPQRGRHDFAHNDRISDEQARRLQQSARSKQVPTYEDDEGDGEFFHR